MHKASVILGLCMSKWKKVEKEWEDYIKLNSSPTVNKETRYLPKKDGGLGMLKLSVFWRSVRMSWLRRLHTTKFTRKLLHREEVGELMFDPIRSNMESLEKAKVKATNNVWRDIYCTLLRCRQNLLLVNPEEYVTFPMNGEPKLPITTVEGRKPGLTSSIQRGVLQYKLGRSYPLPNV